MYYKIGIISFMSMVIVSGFVSADMTGITINGNPMTPQAIVSFSGNTITVLPTLKKKFVAKPRPITLGKFFIDVCSRLGEGVPNVYRDIRISWPNVATGSVLYTALQKCAYLGVIEPKGKITNFQVPVKSNFLYDFFGQKLNMSIPVQLGQDDLVLSDLRESEIHYRVPTYHGIQKLLEVSARSSNSAYENPIIQSSFFNTLSQVYSSIQQNYHYTTGSADDETLTYGAIEGIIDSLHDQYSVYFPPEQSTDFFNSLQGEYYGIGMYVEAQNNTFLISSVIAGGPAAGAGLQAGDIVLSVNDWLIPQVFTVQQVINKIKGPANTIVNLKIQRGTAIFTVSVQRQKIVIPMLVAKKMKQSFIFTINSFGQGLDYLFMDEIAKNQQDIKNASNIIIDLRNNPGGYLDGATALLSQFIPAGEPIVQTELKSHKEITYSNGSNDQIFSGKQLYILINGGTASASEILAGTLKDYYPTAKLIGEKSYGKGSVQTLMSLPNGGSLKYTIALWFTGKTGRTIEKVGLTPDVIIKDDAKTPEDEVLNTVLSW